MDAGLERRIRCRPARPGGLVFRKRRRSQYGIPGWGNNELQWYLPDSAELADGKLVIATRRENVGGTGGNNVFGTIHYGGEFPAKQSSSNQYLVPTDATTEFHTYALEWDTTVPEICWYVDDTLYSTQSSWSTTGAPYPAPFDERFYGLFNVAVGGNFPGTPNSATVVTVTMEVDYVRVYSGQP